MKGYIVCVYENINDNNALKEYAAKATKAVQKYNGKFLIRGGKNITTEGNDFVRTTVIEFSSFDIAKEYFYSKDYQDAHKLLKKQLLEIIKLLRVLSTELVQDQYFSINTKWLQNNKVNISFSKNLQIFLEANIFFCNFLI